MYTLSNVRITQNNTIYLVPCEILPYLNEIYELITTTSVVNAFIAVADKYGIVLIKPEPLKRVITQPPAAPIKARTTQAVDSFILTTVASGFGSIQPYEVNNYEQGSREIGDFRFFTTFTLANMTTEFVPTTTFANMKSKAGPMSTLFKGTFPKAVICSSIDDSNIRDCVGLILENRDDFLMFLPMIHVKLLYLYTPNTLPNTGVFFRRIGCSLDQNSQEVLYKYTGSTDLNITT